jgi:photosystem II stability/assembly factor-like uncharacterized protein
MQGRLLALAAGSTILLSACGGGGDGGGSSPPPATQPTPLPATVAVATGTAPADVAAALAFSNSIAALTGLTFAWTFGDGSSSSEASPSHQYEKAGDYQVKLTVANAAGETRTAMLKVTVGNRAVVQGQMCSGESQSGWCWQYPGPLGPDIGGFAQFLTPQLGWIRADDGSLIKTSDGGVTWQRQRVVSGGLITGLAFADANRGWAVGPQGQVWRTTDGGAVWNQAAFLPPGTQPNAIQALGGGKLRVPYQSSVDNEAAVSLDGGLTWAAVPAQADSVSAITAGGILWRMVGNQLTRSTDLGLTQSNVGELPANCPAPSARTRADLLTDGETGLILRTWENVLYDFRGSFTGSLVFCHSTDSGKTWTRAAGNGLPVSAFGSRLVPGPSIWLVDGALWLVSSQVLYRSVDSGSNWEVVPLPASGGALLAPVGQAAAMLSNGALTLDAGKTWSSDQGVTATAVQKLDSQSYQVMVDGLPYRTTDGGAHWTSLPAQVRSARSKLWGSIALLPNKRVLAYGGNAMLSSNDDGRSWTQGAMFSQGLISSLQFATPTKGWVLGDFDKLYQTLDGGATWAQLWSSAEAAGLPSGYTAALHFLDENRGWMLVGSATLGIRQSSDGGRTWLPRALLPTYLSGPALLGLDAQTALVAGQPEMAFNETAIYKLGIEGSWSLRYRATGRIIQLARQDEVTIWGVGDAGLVVVSTDSGQTWASRNVGVTTSLNAVRFYDADHGWIVGNAGVILATADGGKTWKQQAQMTKQDLLGIAAKDSKTVWVVGTQGTVLATGTGGD